MSEYSYHAIKIHSFPVLPPRSHSLDVLIAVVITLIIVAITVSFAPGMNIVIKRLKLATSITQSDCPSQESPSSRCVYM